MSKNKNTANKPNSTTIIKRLHAFNPKLTRNKIISKQLLFFVTSSDEQDELELSGDDKRPNPSCCELL
ncbi:hypothetical protein H6P87_00880 [Rickettsia tillamookensis]|uniref:Uncharacterized protein n=1 Tax=Rickettsia tillamookensis TaxID=2761623 RepID=A0A9E6SQN8_9RICK|nr:hypothetical protein [Rickettsia tillamookensis]QQV75327.1 hypothetical protein H6P87_00880 [Rickettsia tillamookensis]